MDKQKVIALATAVLKTEAASVTALIARVDDDFVRACEFMLACEGRVVVTGMGKSGHIGNKVAATLASTGTPAFFMHPGEASHGDLGMITPKDVVLAYSNSGETDELRTILPLLRRAQVPMIALTGNPDSTLAREADVHINVSVEKEACPLGLAPTASTTAALAMSDALAVSLLETRGFTAEDFALSHPGGSLGRRLLLHVSDIMHDDATIPLVTGEQPMSDALVEMTRQGLGMVVVVDSHENRQLRGVFTDGDLRRMLDHGEINLHQMLVRDHMTAPCQSVRASMLAAEALQILDEYKINALPVIDDAGCVVGAFNMHDLLRAGVV
ncbi:D-arabinose 5-phosphate isomerase [hydrothermal vent metagenome]|uniref:D-arabinose 5-phosphate isomerase n=1 Tax=hydrothermal vent metagenome TaxID=652676 RepID=A0A3B1AA43_9ZZZZ